ncbi:MAG: DEAD/DEAH box helicase [Leptospiraceae bacterium]|nr:DEAD/DEAH box helicase [Leptospiraceae bacterium]
MSKETESISFKDMNLKDEILRSILDIGYEIPTPIQREIIPIILEGKDVLGQAQTGTGKTAAFALPLLSKINLSKKHPQVLVLAPTRELALQVSEAFQAYSKNLSDFHVLPVYGGQSYTNQIKILKRGVHVIVGTPGRVIDHIKRKNISLDKLECLVLDEGDEMLNMGFLEDIEFVLSLLKQKTQIAIFSATIPNRIREIAQKFQNNPVEISIKVKPNSSSTIQQKYILVKNNNSKLDVLTKILESISFDAMIIFVRTKLITVELTEKLAARGYSLEAINGDLAQKQREKLVDDLRKGKLDILVATSVAARGLDIDRISHVINYDLPSDIESYIHRIGRTGRAGKKGEAIIFITPREFKMLNVLEKNTGHKITEMKLPTVAEVSDFKISQLAEKLNSALKTEDISIFHDLVVNLQEKTNMSTEELAVSILKIYAEKDSQSFPGEIRNSLKKLKAPIVVPTESIIEDQPPVKRNMVRYKIQLGKADGFSKKSIETLFEEEAGLEAMDISIVSIYEKFSIVDLPKGMPAGIYKSLKKYKWGENSKNLGITTLSESNDDEKRHNTIKKPAKKQFRNRKN